MLATKWDKLRDAGFSPEALDTEVVEPVVRVFTDRSIQRELLLRSWRALSPAVSRTDLLAERLDDAFFESELLRDLPRGTWFEINTSNLTTGARFRFAQDLVGDYITGSIPTSSLGLRVADAVAWSCAVPGPFNTSVLRGLGLPCEDDAGPPELVDGGVYDNLGVDALKNRPEMPGLFCIVCNAGGSFDPASSLGWIPVVGDLFRSNSLLHNQVASVRSRQLFREFATGGDDNRDGCMFNLRSETPAEAALENPRPLVEFLTQNPLEDTAWISRLVAFPTTLDKIPGEVARRLVNRGWWLAGATISAYAPTLHREGSGSLRDP